MISHLLGKIVLYTAKDGDGVGTAGEVVPAMVTAVLGLGHCPAVNLKVFTDGPTCVHLKSVDFREAPGGWFYNKT